MDTSPPKITLLSSFCSPSSCSKICINLSLHFEELYFEECCYKHLTVAIHFHGQNAIEVSGYCEQKKKSNNFRKA